MPAGNKVRPRKWSNVLDLYDNGWYSAIWGRFENSKHRALGVRWNGGDDHGYPNQGKNPLWFVEPDFLTKGVLLALQQEIASDPKLGNSNNISVALKEFEDKL